MTAKERLLERAVIWTEEQALAQYRWPSLAGGCRLTCGVGPVVWGLVVSGEDGVRDVLDLLRDELDLAMALAGCRSIDEISFDLLRPE